MSGLSDTGTTGTLPFLDQLNLMNEMTFIVHDMTGTYKGTLWMRLSHLNTMCSNSARTGNK